MVITEQRQDVLVGGAQSVDAFTIKASAKAFQILSSNLYSNPLGSMIRELSTNAYDAHIMVDKKDVPFIITLPNSLEPSFKIRDFGPGLSHNDIMNVYTTFFESTKTNSNDVVGCLGLGSKSPFGVADSFTVTTFFNGEKTIYSAFLNDARIPSIALFHKEPSDEPNGIEIEVAIKEKDFHTFNREVNSQLKYFKTKPTVLGNSDFQWHTEEEYLYTGSNWKMVKGGGNPRVIQGQIQYPINTRDMGTVFDTAEPAAQNLLSRGILFEVNIGDVNIAPSREALSYDDRTSQNLVKAAQTILKELPEQIKTAVQDAATEYEARIKYNDIMSDLGGGYYGRNALKEYIDASGEILWNNKDISSTEIQLKKEEIESATQFTKNYNGRYQKSNLQAYKGWNSKQDEPTWDFQAKPLNRTMWVYATAEDKAVEGRAKQWANENYDSNVQVYIIKTSLTAQQIANRFGLKKSHLVIAADLPKVKKAAPTKNSGDKVIYVQEFYRSSWNKSDQWETVKVADLNDLDGYFVNLDRYDAFDSDNKKISDLKATINAAIELKLIPSTANVYGLRKQNQKREHDLKCLISTIRENAKTVQLSDKVNFGDNTDVARKLQNDWRELEKLQNLVDDNSPIKPMIDALLATRNNKLSYDAEKLINQLELHTVVTDMSQMAEDIDNRYEMIAYGNYSLSAKMMATYIAQVDALYTLSNGIMPKA
jgi:hypothetical protein